MLAAAALSACGYEKTYDGQLETTTQLTEPETTTRSDTRPAILHVRGGQNGTDYRLLDNVGTPPCSFYLPVSAGEEEPAGRGTCTMLLKEGAVHATLVSLRTEESDTDGLVLWMEWAVRRGESDSGSLALAGTLKMRFEGESR